MLTAENLATTHGGHALSNGRGWLIPCPVPSHGKGEGDRNPSLKIWDARDGIGVKCYAGCSARDVLAALNLPINARPHNNTSPRAMDTTEYALQIWRKSRDAKGTLAEIYLNNRGLKLPDWPPIVRFHPSLWYNKEKRFCPTMLTLFQDLATEQPCGITRTFLNDDGGKIERMMLGRVRHAAIKLDSNSKIRSDGALVIGEGFETCLAAKTLGLDRVWALGSAEAVKWFPLIEGVNQLTILGERDTTSKLAVAMVAQRWQFAKRTVFVSYPLRGKDHADLVGRETLK
jgi:putative DNA primase/helicase